MEFVNGKDDIPYIRENKNVWTHPIKQPLFLAWTPFKSTPGVWNLGWQSGKKSLLQRVWALDLMIFTDLSRVACPLSIYLSLSVFLCFFPIWESHIRDILGVHLESCSHNQRQLFEKVLKRARRKNRRKKSGLGSLWISLTCPPDIPQPKK